MFFVFFVICLSLPGPSSATRKGFWLTRILCLLLVAVKENLDYFPQCKIKCTKRKNMASPGTASK